MAKFVRSIENISALGEVFTPDAIVLEMLNNVDVNLINDPTCLFFEPTCGNGQFLIHIYKLRVSAGIDPITALSMLVGYDISTENINDAKTRLIELCKNDIELNILNSIIDDNIRVVDDTLSELNQYAGGCGYLYELKYTTIVTKIVVVGNPPFNSHGNDTSASTLYDKFVTKIIDALKPDCFVFITPSRWMVMGKGIDVYRNRMMTDTHISKIKHYPGDVDAVFKDVKIKGGVSYFVWKKSYNGLCEFDDGTSILFRDLNAYEVIIQDNNAITIIDKILNKSCHWVSDLCHSVNPFWIKSNYDKWIDVGTPCYCTERNCGKTIKYIDSLAFIDKNNTLSKWKVCTSGVTSEGHVNPDKNGKYMIINNIFIIPPSAICTESYIIVAAFDCENMANSFVSYMKTKFFRFMLMQRMGNQRVTKDKFSWVPDLLVYDKTFNDEYLNELYGLSQDEINYIDTKLK